MDEHQHTPTPEETPIMQPCPSCEEYLSGWKRAQADYVNMKKDVERERAEFNAYARASLLRDFLPCIDQFETALAFTPDLASLSESDQKKFTTWVQGLRAVKHSWESVLQSIGAERVSVTGEFKPDLHEAVSYEAHAEVPSGHIARVIDAGWRFNGKLLRPARVIVSQGPQS